MATTDDQAMTLDECAAELRLDSAAILSRAIKAGKLVALVVTGAGEARAPKLKFYRIERGEWERYKASIRTKRAGAEIEANGDEAPKPGRPRKGAAKDAGAKARRWS